MPYVFCRFRNPATDNNHGDGSTGSHGDKNTVESEDVRNNASKEGADSIAMPDAMNALQGIRHLENSGFPPSRLCRNHNFVIPYKRSAIRNPVFSAISVYRLACPSGYSPVYGFYGTFAIATQSVRGNDNVNILYYRIKILLLARSVVMLMASLLADKKCTVHFGIVINIYGRHTNGFEVYRATAIGKLCLMGNIEVFAEKTIDKGALFFIVCH